MKKILFILGCILFIVNNLFAGYLKDFPQTIKQPNGTIINTFVTGDEYYNWLHDANNYTIVQDTITGYYCYATLQNNNLVASTCVVGVSNPSNCGLVPGINLSPDQILSIVNQQLTPPTNSTWTYPNISQTGLKSNASLTLNNIVIYIRFSDQTEFPAKQTTYESYFNDQTPNANSMFNYFNEVSYNKLSIVSTFYPKPTNNGTTIVSYQDIHPRSYYCEYNAVSNKIGYKCYQLEKREDSLIARALLSVKNLNQIDPSINLDANNDGYIDNVCFIIRGNSSKSEKCTSIILWPVQSHYWGAFGDIKISDKKFFHYNIQIESILDDRKTQTLCHEMFHTLGAPDLYHGNYDYKIPVGSWDIMSDYANPPQHMGAYMKCYYGHWIDQISEITTSGSYSLQPLTSETNNAYKIKIKGSNEFLVLEYRKKTGTFESTVPASGLIIYRINQSVLYGNITAKGSGGTTDAVYIFRPDGSTSQEGNLSAANFTSDNNRNTFSNTSNPKCFTSKGALGNIYIKNIGTAGNSISFNVRFCDFVSKTFVSTDLIPTLTNVSQEITTNGAVTVKSVDNVTFEAGTGVLLDAGFEIQKGGEFGININECGLK